MNEFTKEELEEIKRCLRYMTKGGTTPYSLLTMSIHDKVKRMIETYDKPEYCGHSGIKLTKPEPKYKQYDELHHVHMNMPCSFKCTVSRWDDNVKQYVYGYHGEWSLMEEFAELVMQQFYVFYGKEVL